MRAVTIPTVYELSVPGRRGVDLPEPDVPSAELPAAELREDCALPELSQLEVVRHYRALSERNFGIDTGFYPLGSCTMKYNPKVNEEIARLSAFAESHPLAEPDTVQGNLALIFELQRWLAEIGGGFPGTAAARRRRARRVHRASDDPCLSPRTRRRKAHAYPHSRFRARHQSGI